MAEEESSISLNPPSNLEIVSSLRIRDDMLQRFHRLIFMTNIFSVFGNSVNTSINAILKIK